MRFLISAANPGDTEVQCKGTTHAHLLPFASWRCVDGQNNHGKEIDCLLMDGEQITPVEIESGKTISTNYFDNLQYWRQLASLSEDQGYVVYGGEQSMQTGGGALISWRQPKKRIPG